jgi:hypothetical protein
LASGLNLPASSPLLQSGGDGSNIDVNLDDGHSLMNVSHTLDTAVSRSTCAVRFPLLSLERVSRLSLCFSLRSVHLYAYACFLSPLTIDEIIYYLSVRLWLSGVCLFEHVRSTCVCVCVWRACMCAVCSSSSLQQRACKLRCMRYAA